MDLTVAISSPLTLDAGSAGEFMLARYKDVVSTVLSYTRSNEKLIRRAVIQMLPRLAAFAPERFAMKYLQPCTSYLLSVLRNPAERGAGALCCLCEARCYLRCC